jgi:thioesterase domain-containing protein
VTPDELERYFHLHIPLSKAMAVSVVGVDLENVILAAPLAPNINHRETVFGGSASALAILSAWALVANRLHAVRVPHRLVIQSNSMRYDRPISGGFTARSFLPAPDAWPAFLRLFERRGLARIEVAATVSFGEQPAGRLDARFVALRPTDAEGQE